MASVLLAALKQHNEKHRSSMHMPAHKGMADPLAPLAELLPYDLTELPDTGSLFDGVGATQEAEQRASQLFGTAGTFFSAGGASLCIQAMLRLALPQGGKLLCGRVVHRSAIHAMALLGITPVWVLPDSSAGVRFSGRIPPEAIAAQLQAQPDIRGIYLTSPDYFGVLCDIPAIATIAQQHDIPLLVDAAHGAHLHFLQQDLSPLALGADMAAESAHKTLPVLTGGAFLQLAQETHTALARDALALFGSTSPSYPILLSLDLCREWLEADGPAAIRNTVAQAQNVQSMLQQFGFAQPQGSCDPMRIAFSTDSLGIPASFAGDFLRTHGIEPEYAGLGQVILIPSAANTPADFCRLSDAICALAANANANDAFAVLPDTSPPRQLLSPRDALLQPTLLLPISACHGRIAAQAACPCPPAIPAVMPGELVDDSVLLQLKKYGITQLRVVKE